MSESARGHGGSVAWKMTDQADSAGREARQDLRSQKGELPGKVHRARGCRRRILAWQGDPMEVGRERSLGQRFRSLGLREVRLVLCNSWLRPARRSMQWHVGGPGVRRTLVRPRWICSFRPPWDDTSGGDFTAGQGCIQRRFTGLFLARILPSGRWMARWIERWILLWITLWINGWLQPARVAGFARHRVP